MNQTIFLGIGSNVGKRVEYLAKALNEISKIVGTEFVRVSRVYETEPVGGIKQQEFLNIVVEFKTALNVLEFHCAIKEIEKKIGRRESVRWGPREIDIDILLFGDVELNSESLTIPHPELESRNFVLVPFSEIAPAVIHPIVKKPIQNIYSECSDMHTVTFSEHFSNELQSLIKELLANTSR